MVGNATQMRDRKSPKSSTRNRGMSAARNCGRGSFPIREETLGLFGSAFSAIADDSIFISPADVKCFVERLQSEGLSFATRTLPLLDKALLTGLETGTFTCPTNFSLSRNSRLPRFLGCGWDAIFTREGELRQTVNHQAVKEIRQACGYFYKADLPRQESLDQAVIDNFVETERAVRELDFEDDALLRLARSFTAQLFSDFDPESLKPKHGPGVTSNVKNTEKWEHKLSPGLPSYALFGSSFFLNAEDALDRLDRYPTYSHADLFRQRDVSKVILVPKDSRGPRLISCEPCEQQFIQQGLMRYMVRKLETSSLTAGHVNFTDQSFNQRAAEINSVTQEFATLDLKEASDRVSLRLVKMLFGQSSLGYALLSSRTGYTVLPDGRRIELSKFAPMGSALCFPVMAYSLFILMYVALIGVGVHPDKARESLLIFGDDVVCPTEHAPYLIRILERYGLQVNTSKSFIRGKFRESCGADFYDGVNVTPVRLRKPWIQNDTQDDLVKRAALLSKHANELASKRLWHTAEYFYTYSERYLGPLPYGTVTSPYICRAVDTRDFPIYHKEWLSRHQRTRSSFSAWVIRSEITPDVPSTGWGHLYRVIGMLGQDLILPKFGEYSLPRKWSVKRRKFKKLDFFALGGFPPESE